MCITSERWPFGAPVPIDHHLRINLDILLACLRFPDAICSSFIASVSLAESLGLKAFRTVEHDPALPGASPQEPSRP